MHARDRLFGGLIQVLELAIGRYLLRCRVYNTHLLHHAVLVLMHARLAHSLVVTHAKHFDLLVVLSANRILLELGQSTNALPHLPIHIVAHY